MVFRSSARVPVTLLVLLTAACDSEPSPSPQVTLAVSREAGATAVTPAGAAMLPDPAGSGRRWHTDSVRQGSGDTRLVAYEAHAAPPATWPRGLPFIANVEVVTHTRPGALPGLHLVAASRTQADSVVEALAGSLLAGGWAEIAPTAGVGPARTPARSFQQGARVYHIYQMDAAVQLAGAGNDAA